MKKQAGVWMDHRGAVLVFTGDEGERTERIESGVEKHERVKGLSADDAPEGDHRDRHFAEHLDKYYDEVILHLVEADEVFLFGPGEAKGEFQKRMAVKGLGARIVAVETADKMTEPQMTAKVREHFKK
ncbi:MAG: hypothetical protein JJE39_08495 [Vicinamibacteria bacterium]|nr:hypothetical protein [Vicinamibacteria bacterium]